MDLEPGLPEAHAALAEGLATQGLSLLPPEDARLPMLNAVRIPEGIAPENAALEAKAPIDASAVHSDGSLGLTKRVPVKD